jgi:hypothetical protein
MLMSEDQRQLADRSAQLAVACSEPSVAKSLLALALDYMMLATTLVSRHTSDDKCSNMIRLPASVISFLWQSAESALPPHESRW